MVVEFLLQHGDLQVVFVAFVFDDAFQVFDFGEETQGVGVAVVVEVFEEDGALVFEDVAFAFIRVCFFPIVVFKINIF